MKHATARERTSRRLAAALLAPLLLLGAVVGALAEEPLPSAEEIMDRYVEAIGGREAYDKIENRVTKATLEFVGQGLSLDLTIYQARPNKSYTLIESEMLGKSEKGTDGETAWELSMMTGPQIMNGKQKADFLRDAALDRLAHWREQFSGAEAAGVETVGEIPCYKVVLTQQDGPPLTLYLDRESYLTVKMEMDLETPMGIVPMQTWPGDYRQVDGLLLAFSGRVVLVGQERFMTVHEIEHNVDLPADLFDLPDEIRAAMNKEAAGE